MAKITEDRVTELMVDRSRSDLQTYNEGYARAEPVLEVVELRTSRLAPLSFTVHAGEVFGVTGPVGGGMEEVGRALGGVTRHSGKVICVVWGSMSRHRLEPGGQG